MRIKHWAGYGSVEAHKVNNGCEAIQVEVRGDHERGLMPPYFTDDDWHRWLGKRFRIDPTYKVTADEWFCAYDMKWHLLVSFYKEV